jgi:hypothetical protein
MVCQPSNSFSLIVTCSLPFPPNVVAGVYPLQNVFIRKVKVLKAPKFDLVKLMEVHGDYSAADAEAGAKVDRPAEAGAAVAAAMGVDA